MEKVKTIVVKLEVASWYWNCPVCHAGNTVDNDDLWNGESEKHQQCDSCENAFDVTTQL